MTAKKPPPQFMPPPKPLTAMDKLNAQEEYDEWLFICIRAARIEALENPDRRPYYVISLEHENCGVYAKNEMADARIPIEGDHIVFQTEPPDKGK